MPTIRIKQGSTIFQKISDAVRYITKITNYIDDLILHFVCSKTYDSFNTLQKVLIELGFDINERKIIAPSMKVTCLSVEINTENFTVSTTAERNTSNMPSLGK